MTKDRLAALVAVRRRDFNKYILFNLHVIRMLILMDDILKPLIENKFLRAVLCSYFIHGVDVVDYAIRSVQDFSVDPTRSHYN